MYQKIPPRNFIEQFFTFLIPVDNGQGHIRFFKWRPEPALKRHISLYQEDNDQFLQMCQAENAPYLVQEFLEAYENETGLEYQQEMAKWHLAAYLETPLYKAVKERFEAFRDFKNPQNTWEHYLHIAKCLTNEPKAIALIYQKYKSQTYSLDEHFKLELASKIRDIFNRETGQGKYSPWYSLKQASERDLEQGLKTLGIKPGNIVRYLTAKNCLFEVYSKSTKGWRKPNLAKYQEARDYCKLHYFSISTEQFERLIQTCIRALQSSPQVLYFGDNIETYFQESNRWDEGLSSEPWLAIEEEISTKKMQDYVEGINQVLLNELKTFTQDQENSKMLILRYGLELSEPSIAQQLGLNQATINRRCTRLHRKLLKSAAVWVQESLTLDLMELQNVDEYIDKWLKQHYQAQIESVMRTGLEKHLTPQSSAILRMWHFHQIKDTAHIARQLKIQQNQVKQQVAEAENQLLAYLIKWVSTTINISLDQKREQKKVVRVIARWLTNN